MRGFSAGVSGMGDVSGALTVESRAAPASLRSVASWEWVDVRCPSGALVTRIKRRPGTYPDGSLGEPLSEHQCEKCRHRLIVSAFPRAGREDVVVLHYVSAQTARIVETRAIMNPVKGAAGPNRGGQLIPTGVFDDAIASGGHGAQAALNQEVIHGR